jgi:hypothetical protein
MDSPDKTPLKKAPCLYPLPGGRRCCECATCQPSPEELVGPDKTPQEREIVGVRTVDENVMFFYDRMKNPLCVHGVSVYEPCKECPRG